MKDNPVFEVNDIVIMNRAGGWGFNKNDNGLLAMVTDVGVYPVRGKNEHAISGFLIERDHRGRMLQRFSNIPVVYHEGKWTVLPITDKELSRVDQEYVYFQEIEI